MDKQKRKLEDFVGWCKIQKLADSLKPWSPPLGHTCSLNDTLECDALIKWLALNIRAPRQPRQLQLWLWGPPGIGKSRLVGQLRTMLRIYDMPKDEEYYDHYDDGSYDLVVVDEFKHQKRIQFLNAWADGQPLALKQKGSQTVKYSNLPLIILSNYSISQCYRDGVGRDALVSRFVEVAMTSTFQVYWSAESGGEAPPGDVTLL